MTVQKTHFQGFLNKGFNNHIKWVLVLKFGSVCICNGSLWFTEISDFWILLVFFILFRIISLIVSLITTKCCTIHKLKQCKKIKNDYLDEIENGSGKICWKRRWTIKKKRNTKKCKENSVT